MERDERREGWHRRWVVRRVRTMMAMMMVVVVVRRCDEGAAVGGDSDRDVVTGM